MNSVLCADGMVKSNKVSLGRELKKTATIITGLLLSCISIFDGVVLVQNIPKHCSTFGEISDYLLMKMLSATQKMCFSSLIDI